MDTYLDVRIITQDDYAQDPKNADEDETRWMMHGAQIFLDAFKDTLKPKNQRKLCFTCDYEFDLEGGPPCACVVARNRFEPDNGMATGGVICCECIEDEDILSRVKAAFGKIYPGSTILHNHYA
ncbi:hypothetical protein RB623_06850 [Mesorhizobium sp. LHD-90]|uniref:hypothetical protein n=1 Tax=Mesorhizobium sp. LHD-90 TaxID=3071414 RepID=UPI0027E19BC7|nr:hypothetical protein [Mesorhizobium sp. LHD-90]MDQ6433769.1 hypothetical protein [Mesorhizobium sp. LHD-90]